MCVCVCGGGGGGGVEREGIKKYYNYEHDTSRIGSCILSFCFFVSTPTNLNRCCCPIDSYNERRAVLYTVPYIEIQNKLLLFCIIEYFFPILDWPTFLWCTKKYNAYISAKTHIDSFLINLNDGFSLDISKRTPSNYCML